MLELFKREIPEIDKLKILIQKMLNKKKCTLEDIKEAIHDHISEHEDLDTPEDYDRVESTAFNAVDNLINDLDVNVTNYNRLQNYLSLYHSFSGFNRLVLDFQMFLTKRELLHLIDHGRIIFGADKTRHWKPIRGIVLTLLKQDKLEKFADAYQRYKSAPKKKS